MRLKNRLVQVERTGERSHIVIRLPLPTLHIEKSELRETTSYVTALVLLTAGVVGMVLSLSGTTQPVIAAQHQSAAKVAKQAGPDSLSRSLPTSLTIPDIGVSTDLTTLGKNDDGTMQTPEDYAVAGWYKHSPTPGEIGPAIIAGHVDNYLGPAVFFRLKELQPGQHIEVAREDGRIATFSVEKVEVFDQSNFPTDAVYGNIDHAGLRLITCGGTYDVLSARYSHNVVVFASLTSSKLVK